MGETVKSVREKGLNKSPLDSIWSPECQIPCILIYPKETPDTRLESILKPLVQVLTERGFRPHALSEESLQEGDTENLTRECALGVLLLSGAEQALQYSYGYLKGKGKFVLTVRDIKGSDADKHGGVGQSQLNEPGLTKQNSGLSALNEILVDSSTESSSPGSTLNILREEMGSFIPAVLESYISELTKTYSTIEPELYLTLGDIAQEVSDYYTNCVDYEINDLDKVLGLVEKWERNSEREVPVEILTMLASLYSARAEHCEEELRRECYVKALALFEGVSSSSPDKALCSCVKMKIGEILALSNGGSADIDKIDKAITNFQDALKYFTRDRSLPLSSYINKELGGLYKLFAEHTIEEGEKKKLYENSLTHIRAALEYYNEEEYQHEYSYLKNLQGMALSAQSERESSLEGIWDAIETLKESLRFKDPESSPVSYAEVHVNLGNAYRTQAEIDASAENCILAIESYERALKVYKEEGAALESALVYNNLGASYDMLAQIEESAEHCVRAVSSYEEALKVYTLSEFPEQYATSQNNIGNAYSTLADIKDQALNSEKAITSYKESLMVKSFEEFPLDYARTQNNLGVVYSTLAEVQDCEDNGGSAVSAYTEALRVYGIDEYPLERAMISNNLGDAYTVLSSVIHKVGHLKLAVQCYREALSLYTEDEYALNAAILQKKLGDTLLSLSELESDNEYLHEASSSYKRALEFYTKDEYPRDYALIKMNEGRLLHLNCSTRG